MGPELVVAVIVALLFGMLCGWGIFGEDENETQSKINRKYKNGEKAGYSRGHQAAMIKATKIVEEESVKMKAELDKALTEAFEQGKKEGSEEALIYFVDDLEDFLEHKKEERIESYTSPKLEFEREQAAKEAASEESEDEVSATTGNVDPEPSGTPYYSLEDVEESTERAVNDAIQYLNAVSG